MKSFFSQQDWKNVVKFLILTIGLIIGGCSSVHEWSSSKPFHHSVDDIWNATYYVIGRRYDIIKASRQDMELETDWKVKLSVYYLKGVRNKIHAKIEEYVEEADEEILEENESPKDTPKRYQVKVQAIKEQNRAADYPAALSEAEWYPLGNNAEEEVLLINFITSRLALKDLEN